ncbi:DUF6612 family protein [Salibacterium lacus]|uniref:DUF6612 family protein n=1 Tax=Salibacterium lacus TaxID=1898109 RepID=A0ABW5T312_9BACI
MKKRTALVFGVSCVFMLGACSEEGEQQSSQTDASVDNAEDVLTQSVEAMSDVNSYSIDMDMQQEMKMGEQTTPVDTSISMDIVQDPLSFAQEMTTTNPSTGEDMVMEQYLAEDGTIYMEVPMQNTWMKTDASSLGIENLEDIEMSPEAQLDMLREVTENMTMEEEEGQYVLHIEGSGDKLLEIGTEFAMMESDPQMEDQLETIMNAMDIESFQYTMYIDKETFYQEEMEMSMDLSIEEGGSSMEMSQTTSAVMSGFNETESVDVPSEAVENAGEMEEDMMQPNTGQ